MTYLCLWSRAWRGGSTMTRLQTTLLGILPRVVLQGDLIWGDIRGLPMRLTVRRVVRVLQAHDAGDAQIGIAETAIAAEVAARYASARITYVKVGEDRPFLAPWPVSVLQPSPALANLLDGTGVELCSELAALTRESVEVRFGGDAVSLWRLSRADDLRPLFVPSPRELPESSLEWSDYTLRRADRLLFVINALCKNVCDALATRGDGAVVMTLRFVLANRTSYEHPLRVARATARQHAWMRLIRLELERITLPDAVLGLSLRVDHTAGLGGKQGDIFDRGFGTIQAAEESVGELLDDHGAIVVVPNNTMHPLIDQRTTWDSVSAIQAVDPPDTTWVPITAMPALTLQVLPKPVRITVATMTRRGVDVPKSYRDAQGVHQLVDVAGPDQLAGGEWNDPYAREYFRGVNTDGLLVWLYREVRTGAWYLHGWWD